jgi:hypothetical protein
VPYQIRTQRGEETRYADLPFARSEAMDEGARALVAAFEADTAASHDYGNQSAYSSIVFLTNNVTEDAVPLSV